MAGDNSWTGHGTNCVTLTCWHRDHFKDQETSDGDGTPTVSTLTERSYSVTGMKVKMRASTGGLSLLRADATKPNSERHSPQRL